MKTPKELKEITDKVRELQLIKHKILLNKKFEKDIRKINKIIEKAANKGKLKLTVKLASQNAQILQQEYNKYYTNLGFKTDIKSPFSDKNILLIISWSKSEK